MKAKIKDKILFFLYPFRDSVGLTVGSTPFRIGEIYTIIYSFLLAMSTRNLSLPRINKRVRNIFLLLILNLLLVLVVSYSYSYTIDVDFCKKYIIRNTITVILFLCIYKVYIVYSDKLMITGMKWNIILQILAAILFFVFSRRIFLNQLSSIWDIQTAYYGVAEIPRYPGTCSEAGYLGPLLAMPLYYFLFNFKQNKVWFTICVILMVVTVSTSNYFILLLTFMFYIYNKNKKTFSRFMLIMFAALVIFLGITELFLKDTLFYTIINDNLSKFQAYITLGTYGQLDWSASDRVEHLTNATNMFLHGNVLQMIFGQGTGAYSFFATNNAHLLVQNVNEAYNLYLSTLTDRGIIGLVIFIMIFYNVYKMKSDNIISNAIWYGLVIQFVHYMIVGNMWLYYVWQEVLFLIGYEIYLEYHNKLKDDKTQNYKRFFARHKLLGK